MGKSGWLGGIRPKIMLFVGALVLLCLGGSTLSLYRITEVHRALGLVTSVAVPLGRVLAQLEFDAEFYRREAARSVTQSQPGRERSRWIEDLVLAELKQVRALVARPDWQFDAAERGRFAAWSAGVESQFEALRKLELQAAHSIPESREIVWSRWSSQVEAWKREIHSGGAELDRALKRRMEYTQAQIADLRMGLEVILAVVVALSLLLLWIGERALRPLGELTRLARHIAERGLRRADKVPLQTYAIDRDDEVSRLAREFRNMATALLEREKTVEAQNATLEEQNRQLREMSALQERLRSAEQLAALGRLSAQVAHEIRNPLHSIGLEAELALEEAARSGRLELKESLRSILASVERLTGITDNYLKLSRTQPGEAVEFDMGDALENSLALYAGSIQAHQIRLNWRRIDRDPHALRVMGDRTLTEQAIGNLIRNAIQAVEALPDAERAIEIELSRQQLVVLRIEDSGPGFDPVVRDQVFTPFFTTKAMGTGLGLSFVRQIVERQGGTIEIGTARHLRGACLELRMPVPRLAQHAPSELSGAHLS